MLLLINPNEQLFLPTQPPYATLWLQMQFKQQKVLKQPIPRLAMPIFGCLHNNR
jgi:hypothetical protein